MKKIENRDKLLTKRRIGIIIAFVDPLFPFTICDSSRRSIIIMFLTDNHSLPCEEDLKNTQYVYTMYIMSFTVFFFLQASAFIVR